MRPDGFLAQSPSQRRGSCGAARALEGAWAVNADQRVTCWLLETLAS